MVLVVNLVQTLKQQFCGRGKQIKQAVGTVVKAGFGMEVGGLRVLPSCYWKL